MWPAACIVPETAPSLGWLCPLVPLFSPLVHLSPIPGLEPAEEAARVLVQEGRLISLSSAPPPSGRAELELLARMPAGRDAARYGEQLRALFLERLGTDRGATEEEALLRLRAGAPAADPLWHERLQLVLADRVERENEELAAALARINTQHQSLLATLGEGDSPQTPPTPLTASAAGGGQPWQAKRLRAWARLFAAVTPPPRPDMWYLTRQQECCDAILEGYRRLTGRRELSLPELLLPACGTPAEDGQSLPRPARCPGLSAALSRLLSAVHAPCTTLAAILQEAMTLFSEQVPVWNATMRSGSAAASAPLCRLQLLVLPDASWTALLRQLDTGGPTGDPTPAVRPALCLFGLLQDQ